MKVKSNTKGINKLIADLRKMHGGKLEWGFYEEDKYPDPRGADSAADVARLVEEGHPNGGIFEGTTTPARPFFSNAVNDEENIRELRRAIKHLQRKVLQGKITPEDKMEGLGEIVKRQLEESILNFSGVPLQDSTLDMREWREHTEYGDSPILETGFLLESIKFKVTGVD